jgi:hypothetical protein
MSNSAQLCLRISILGILIIEWCEVLSRFCLDRLNLVLFVRDQSEVNFPQM